MRVHFTEGGWDDYAYWAHHDPGQLLRINELIADTRRTPFAGLGKPEALKHDLAGCWSRRITREHRLVYTVEGKGADRRITVISCRYHY